MNGALALTENADKACTELKRLHRMVKHARLVCFYIKGRVGKIG